MFDVCFEMGSLKIDIDISNISFGLDRFIGSVACAKLVQSHAGH